MALSSLCQIISLFLFLSTFKPIFQSVSVCTLLSLSFSRSLNVFLTLCISPPSLNLLILQLTLFASFSLSLFAHDNLCISLLFLCLSLLTFWPIFLYLTLFASFSLSIFAYDNLCVFVVTPELFHLLTYVCFSLNYVLALHKMAENLLHILTSISICPFCLLRFIRLISFLSFVRITTKHICSFICMSQHKNGRLFFSVSVYLNTISICLFCLFPFYTSFIFIAIHLSCRLKNADLQR